MSGVKGFATWHPRAAKKKRLEEVLDVIMRGKDDWPLSQRYWLYRMMGVYGWEKFDEYTASDWKQDTGKEPPRTPYNLNWILDRGRRAGIIPWEAVHSSRGMDLKPYSFDTSEELADDLGYHVEEAQFDRQAGQDRRVVLWMETEGLAPTMRRTAEQYGATVLAGKGFDVIGRKYDFACNAAALGRVLILHCGDLDKSGHTVKESLKADLTAFITGLGAEDCEIERLALTEAQVHEYGLTFTEVEPGLNKGNHGAGFDSKIECQLEAMDISDIRRIVESAFERHLDMDLVRKAIDEEPRKRAEALKILLDRTK